VDEVDRWGEICLGTNKKLVIPKILNL